MFPLTSQLAKPLLPVAGRPIVSHVLDKFSNTQGIDEVIVLTNNKFYTSFQEWISTENGHLPFKVNLLNNGTQDEQQKLGMCGDISYVIETLKIDDDLIVVGGENLFGADLSEFVQRAHEGKFLVGTYDLKINEAAGFYNTLETDETGRITFFDEKAFRPKNPMIALSLYSYPKSIVKYFKRYLLEGNNPDQPGRVIQWLYKRHPIYAHQLKGPWLDVTTIDQYFIAQRMF